MEVLAQFVTNILAFLLLLFILKKFAWGSLLKLIDERRDKIAGQFGAIEQGKMELAQLKEKYEASLAKIEEEARVKIQEAVAQGRKIAMEIEEDAREHSRDTFEKTKESIALEVAQARIALKEQVVDLAIQLNHKVLEQQLDEKTDQRMIEAFIKEINNVETGRG
jgi:F-type H+-transporting ATPase subunit b